MPISWPIVPNVVTDKLRNDSVVREVSKNVAQGPQNLSKLFTYKDRPDKTISSGRPS